MRKPAFVLSAFAMFFSVCCFTFSADTLYTSSLIGPTGDAIYCWATNISSSTISVTIALYDETGTAVQGPQKFSIAAKSSQGFVKSMSVDHSYYCKFTTGNKAQVRASAELYNSTEFRQYNGSEAR